MRSKSRSIVPQWLLSEGGTACLSKPLWLSLGRRAQQSCGLETSAAEIGEPISPIKNSDTVQDVQVQADLGGKHIDRTSLQMHRRGGRWTQKACNSMSAPSSKPPLSRSSSSPSV